MFVPGNSRDGKFRDGKFREIGKVSRFKREIPIIPGKILAIPGIPGLLSLPVSRELFNYGKYGNSNINYDVK